MEYPVANSTYAITPAWTVDGLARFIAPLSPGARETLPPLPATGKKRRV